MGTHLIGNEFQSDKYPTTPLGKVPLSCKDPTAQDLLWEYAQRRRSVDAEFSADLEAALMAAGYVPASTRPIRTPPALVEWKRVVNDAYLLLTDIREDAVWQMGVNEWLQHALSVAERVKATPVEEPPSSPSRERVEVLEARRLAIEECAEVADAKAEYYLDQGDAGVANQYWKLHAAEEIATSIRALSPVSTNLKAPSDG